MKINKRESIFTERFRPQTVEDIILPQKMKEKIKQWIKDDEIPNITLVSKQPGLGKTSLAHVLINELETDALFVNLSLDRNIDTLRGKIQGFVSTEGFSDKPKIVVLDEADGTSEMFQKALRGFMEQFTQSARFIITANYKEKLLPAVLNRTQVYDFDEIFNKNKAELIKLTAQRIVNVLKYENISYSKEDLLLIVKNYYPSTRSMLISIQENIVQEGDKKTLKIENINKTENIDEVIIALKKKDYESFRSIVSHLSTPDILFSEINKRIDDFDISKRPQITILNAKYSYQHAFARDQLVNVLAFGAEIIGIL